MRMRLVSIAAAGIVGTLAMSGAASAEEGEPSIFFGSFWKIKEMSVEGGTVKSGDYETCGKECSGPSDKEIMEDMDLGGRNPKTPPSPEPEDKRKQIQ